MPHQYYVSDLVSRISGSLTSDKVNFDLGIRVKVYKVSLNFVMVQFVMRIGVLFDYETV